MAKVSNQLKVVLFPGEITDMKMQVHQNQCLTIQEFSYCCERNRDEHGEPFGPTVSVIMQFTVRIVNVMDGKVFYERLNSLAPQPYTFLFNAAFNPVRQLTAYDDSMMVHGHIVDLSESYTNQPADGDTTNQVLISVQLLLSDITYQGNMSDLKLEMV